MSNKNKGVMIFSGGMDSAAMLRMVQFNSGELHCITFDYGQRHRREIEYAKIQIEHAKLISFSHNFEDTQIYHKIIDVTFLKELITSSSLTNEKIDNPNVKDMIGEAQPVSYVPFRNQIFLSIACAHAESIGADTVYHGATQVDSLAGYWDGSEQFREQFQALIDLNRKEQIKLMCPLLAMNKKAIVEYGASSKIDYKYTYTCYSGDEIADATTPSSSLRIKGFADAGYIDPQPYKQNLTKFWKKNKCVPFPEEVFISLEGTRGP